MPENNLPDEQPHPSQISLPFNLEEVILANIALMAKRLEDMEDTLADIQEKLHRIYEERDW